MRRDMSDCDAMAERPHPKRRSLLTGWLASAYAVCPLLVHADRSRSTFLTPASEVWAGVEYPILNVFLFLAIITLLVVALLKRRHRSELLAVCLALSIVLHLLSLSLFSVMPIGRASVAVAPRTGIHRIEVGKISFRELKVAQSLRAEPLKTDRINPQSRLEVDRIARRERVREGAPKTLHDLPEAEARSAEREDIKTPDLILPKPAMDDPMTVVPHRPVERVSVKLAVPQPAQAAMASRSAEPGAREKKFEVAPAAARPAPAEAPAVPRAELKKLSQAPSVTRVELALVEGRQPEIKDAIQAAAARVKADRLAVPAQAVTEMRQAERTDESATGVEVKLTKLAGAAPRTADPRMATAPKSAGRTRLAEDSVAPAGPSGIQRKQNEIEGMDSDSTMDMARLDPLKMDSIQPLLTVSRTETAGSEAAMARADQREWAAAQEKQADVPVSLPAPTVKPGVAKSELREASPMSAGARLNLAAMEGRRLEVKDAIQPAAVRAEVEHVQVRAGIIESAGRNERVAAPRTAAEVKLAKLAGAAPRAADPRMATAPKPAGRTRLAEDSVAPAGLSGIQRKQKVVDEVGVGTATETPRLEPVRLGGQQQLVATVNTGAFGQASSSAPEGKADWATSRERSAVSGVSLWAAGTPRAGVSDVMPSKDPIRVGLGGQALAEPASFSPSVRDVVSDLPAGRPKVQAVGDLARTMALVKNGRGAADLAIEEKYASSDLPVAKQSGGLSSVQVGSGVGAVRPAGIRTGSDGMGRPASVVEASGGGLRVRGLASAEVTEQLAGLPVGGDAGLADVGSPARPAATGIARTAPLTNTGSGIYTMALAPVRSGQSGVPAEAGGGGAVNRPSPTGRSDLSVAQDSFVGQGSGGGVVSRAVSSGVAEEGQLAMGTSVKIAGGGAKALAGRVTMDHSEGGGRRLPGGGEGAEQRAQAELALGKAGGAVGSGIASRPVRVPGDIADAGGGQLSSPAGTLVVASPLRETGSASTTGSGTVRGEILMAMNTSADVSDGGSPVLVAPTVKTRSGSAKVSGKPGFAPMRVLRVVKAGGGERLQSDPSGDGGRDKITAAVSGAGDRGSVRMEMSLSEGPPSARVTSDISASPSGPSARRSFLSVGSMPKPDFVPDKAIYQMRKPQKRRQFIKELGGTAQTEQAVEQALDWLSRTQSEDGRWDIDGFPGVRQCGGAGDLINEDVAVTGLSLLAYLGAGYTHIEDVHQETVRKALDWLLSVEKENGDLRGPGQMYGQAIATAALCEAYSLTGDARLREPVKRAVQFIVDSQTPEAGWRYEPRNDSDTSVTGWQILALKSAQIAGIPVPTQTIAWTELWLDKVRHGTEGGLYSYKPGHAVTPVMTAEGAFCQLFMAEKERTRGQAESTAYIMQNLPCWDPKKRSVHMYYWYYGTLALYLSGAKEFEAWNVALTKALLEGRRTSGPAAGSWDPVCHLGPRGGRIYSTASAALCLEVYYRFLPLYKQK